ncbi:MAG: hypothetical protein ACT4SY_15455 [Hyphomicrobiales bacterium]
MLKLAFASSLLFSVAVFSVEAQAVTAPSRSAVASSLASACEISTSKCLSEVRRWIAAEQNCGIDQTTKQHIRACRCDSDRRRIAYGVADAAIAVSETNVELATRMLEEVARSASVCFQSAFALITDDGGGPGDIGGSPG